MSVAKHYGCGRSMHELRQWQWPAGMLLTRSRSVTWGNIKSELFPSPCDNIVGLRPFKAAYLAREVHFHLVSVKWRWESHLCMYLSVSISTSILSDNMPTHSDTHRAPSSVPHALTEDPLCAGVSAMFWGYSEGNVLALSSMCLLFINAKWRSKNVVTFTEPFGICETHSHQTALWIQQEPFPPFYRRRSQLRKTKWQVQGHLAMVTPHLCLLPLCKSRLTTSSFYLKYVVPESEQFCVDTVMNK